MADRPPLPSALPTPAGRPAPADPGLCVYYDGGCPLCRAEIAAYQRTEGGESLQWVDAQACEPAALGPGLARPDALARMHVRRADGTLLQGAAAFAAIWAALPRWRWLARLAALPGAVPLLDLGYRVFLRVRPLWRKAPGVADALPLPLRRELRTDHAGETGAVMIYRGVLAVSRDAALRGFARAHLRTEQRHLALLEELLPPGGRSRLLPLWRAAGWLTGALPACFGPRAVHATIEAVETFVDRHYAAQVAWIDAELASAAMPAGPARAALAPLRELLEECRLDECDHREDAAARWDGRAGWLLAAWRRLVAAGSVAAVAACRRI